MAPLPRRHRTSLAALSALTLLCSPASAQFPRLVPPPPCRVPIRAANPAPAMGGVYASRRIGISVAVLPFDRVVEDFERVHIPWALQTLVTRELARNERLRVYTPGSVARAVVIGGRLRDSIASLLDATYIVQGQFTSTMGGETALIAMYKAGQTTPVWRASFSAAWSLQGMVGAITSGIERALVRNVERERPGPSASDAAYDEMAAGDFALLSGWTTPDSARLHFERALALDGKSALAAVRLAHVYATVLEREGEIPGYGRNGIMNRIFALTSQALARDSALVGGEAWSVRAMLARLRDPVRFTGALAAHQRALARAPSDPEVVHELGVTLLRLGDDRKAESYFRRALQLEPNRAASLSSLSEVSVRAERWEEACALTNVSIDAWPYSAMPYAMRARARLRLAQTRDAYADAETAGKLVPGVWSRALRVLVDADAGNQESARRQARVFSADWLAPGRSLAVRDAAYAAMAFVAVDDQRRAVEAIRRARPLGADLVSALNDRRLFAIRSDTAVIRVLRQSMARPVGP